jgi:hypothetical protein
MDIGMKLELEGHLPIIKEKQGLSINIVIIIIPSHNNNNIPTPRNTNPAIPQQLELLIHSGSIRMIIGSTAAIAIAIAMVIPLSASTHFIH